MDPSRLTMLEFCLCWSGGRQDSVPLSLLADDTRGPRMAEEMVRE